MRVLRNWSSIGILDLLISLGLDVVRVSREDWIGLVEIGLISSVSKQGRIVSIHPGCVIGSQRVRVLGIHSIMRVGGLSGLRREEGGI
jgi:hypothetical protein